MTTIAGGLPISSYSVMISPSISGVPAVSKTSDPVLAKTAVTLSGEAGIVATLGQSNSATPTYDAVGLLNALIQAGTPTQPAPLATTPTTTTTPQAAQQSQDQAIIGSLSSSPATSGLYTASGVVQAPS